MTYGEFTGFDKSILKLDNESLRLRKLLAINAHLLRIACSDLNNAQAGRLEQPQYNDFVYEATTLSSNNMEKIAKGIGIYLRPPEKPHLYLVPEEGDFSEDETVFIQYGPEREDVYGWNNALFYVIPSDFSLFPLR